MKYVLTYEAHTGFIKTDKTPYNYNWTGVDMTSTGEVVPWSYEKTPEITRKVKNRKAYFDAKKRERKKKSLEIKAAKTNVDIALNKDTATFARNTFSPGKAG